MYSAHQQRVSDTFKYKIAMQIYKIYAAKDIISIYKALRVSPVPETALKRINEGIVIT
jgi:hypothetical protein